MTDKDGGASTEGTAAGSPREASVTRPAVVWEALQGLLAGLSPGGDTPLEIVDAGGGTGGAAVPLAELGHRVTVVEPSPDSLAALERRAAEAGVRVQALQGETGDLSRLLPAREAHLVLVHNVLEYVDDPLRALTDVMEITRPGGAVSVLAANTVAGALHRALAGHVSEAHQLLVDPDGRWGSGDPMPRRFTAEQLTELAERTGLIEPSTRGVRVFADLLPGRACDADTQEGPQLLALERIAAAHPALSGIATQLHVVAHRPGA
ncbi:methyltransferase family protein [Haloactinospora alba]|uniref:Methyltransferase family protein n=1 Tax=Haloactinospora alba TaxID=405555 RepID=A0A543NJL9_9ACTN|nr:methyltransferase [Haloactinospora alba]TQN31996.1 methyltransferase family protein [Haloactinospora alba]